MIGGIGSIIYNELVNIRHKWCILRHDVGMEMSNCLFNTFNYFSNMIISEVICAVAMFPVMFYFSFFQHIERAEKEKGEANYNYRYEK